MNNTQRSNGNKNTINVMIVDDSAVIRGMMARALETDPYIHIAASVSDGEMAVSAVRHYPIDVIILDIEMPRMDGLTALPKLLETNPKVKIIMVSSLTLKGADVSLKALSMGAADCMAKPSSSRDKNESDIFFKELVQKVKSLGGINIDETWKDAVPAILTNTSQNLTPKTYDATPSRYPASAPKALAIASSTGGPQALLTLFKGLSNHLKNIPIFITQHMPANFTTILAGNIAAAVGRDCHEAVDGEVVKAGVIYLAPGNYHMIPKRLGTDICISLNQNPPVNFCRPAADPMIEALIQIYGKEFLLAILTGMGHDGFSGAKKLVAEGGTVVAQDEESSVVWGMPRAVIEHKIHSAALPITGFAQYFIRAFGEK